MKRIKLPLHPLKSLLARTGVGKKNLQVLDCLRLAEAQTTVTSLQLWRNQKNTACVQVSTKYE